MDIRQLEFSDLLIKFKLYWATNFIEVFITLICGLEKLLRTFYLLHSNWLILKDLFLKIFMKLYIILLLTFSISKIFFSIFKDKGFILQILVDWNESSGRPLSADDCCFNTSYCCVTMETAGLWGIEIKSNNTQW